MSTRYIPSGDELHYKGRAVREKGLIAALPGLFNGMAIDSLSPAVDSGLGIEETFQDPKSKKMIDSTEFLPLSPAVDNKG